MLLGQPRLLLWVWSKVGKFAAPAGTENGRPFWHQDDVYRWAASTHPELIRRIPIRCWPDAKHPAIYYGAREIEDATVQTWRTDPGTVCVVWSRPPRSELSLRDVAAQLPDADALIQVQSNFDNVAQYRSTTGALGTLRTLAECEQRSIKYGRHNGDVTVVAAPPLPVPDVDDKIVDEQRRRAGWLEILGRTDQLAAECVRQVDMWDGGADFPFSNPEQIDPSTEYGAEWSARLEPIERTVAFEHIDFEGQRETLTDPETGAPAVRQPDGLLMASIPQRLATFSPLAEVILDSPIWVRTEDGTLYPAPKDSYFGLSWGYCGSGPASLALLISRLLDDINARGADDIDGAPDGLEKLTQIAWPPGTVFTRAQLEAARAGRPYAEE